MPWERVWRNDAGVETVAWESSDPAGSDIAPVAVDEAAARSWLDAKATSHEAHGWTVLWDGTDSFTATKARDGDPPKTRAVFIRQV